MPKLLINTILMFCFLFHSAFADQIYHTSVGADLDGKHFGFQYNVNQNGPGGHVYFDMDIVTPIFQKGQTVDATQQHHWDYFNSADLAAISTIFLPIMRPKLIVTVGTPGLVCPKTDHIVKNNYEITVKLEVGVVGDIIHPFASYSQTIGTEDALPQPGPCPWKGWYIPDKNTGYMLPNP